MGCRGDLTRNHRMEMVIKMRQAAHLVSEAHTLFAQAIGERRCELGHEHSHEDEGDTRLFDTLIELTVSNSRIYNDLERAEKWLKSQQTETRSATNSNPAT